MKLEIKRQQLGGSPPAQWLRRAGYVFITDYQSGQESFARRFTRDFYPRFHLYIQETPGSDLIVFNLHLDQKKASYVGQTRHSADYDGELVSTEIARLRALLDPLAPISVFNANPAQQPSGGASKAAVSPALDSVRLAQPRRSWWQKLFS